MSLTPVTSSRSQKDDELITTILPSYHMFESTISKKLIPNDENFKGEPPTYELSPLNSGGITPAVSSPAPTPEPLMFPFPHMPEEDMANETYNQNSADLFETTVLANVHKLDNLAELKNPTANKLDVHVFFTESVCQKGVKPEIIDPSHKEFKQGDYIHGYVTIKNTSAEVIPFDMVYVVFEGILTVLQQPNGVKNADHPPTVFKFLNMLDLFASWSFANINRLVTDEGDPHDWCEGETDPYDNCALSLDVKRLFQPGVTYKRFFSFRVPDRLLDDTCDVHNLDGHTQIPPSLGNPLNLNVSDSGAELHTKKIKDLSFMDSFIGYSVSARVLGRSKDYGHKKAAGNKYVLVKEDFKPIRVIPFSNIIENQALKDFEVRSYFEAFTKMVESKIEEGKLVLERMKSESNLGGAMSLAPSSLASSRNSLTNMHEKLRHLYVSPSSDQKGLNSKQREERQYQHSSSYRKKTLTGFSKVLGTLTLSTPRAMERVPYVPPKQFRNPLDPINEKIKIPIEITYTCEGKQAPPEPKSIGCELVALTIRSKKRLIPVEINHDMCFLNETVDDLGLKKIEDVESFDSIIVKPYQDYYQMIVSLMKKIGFDNDSFRVETLLFKDIKSLAMLQTKKINLVVPDVQITRSDKSSHGTYSSLSSVPWEESVSPVDANYGIYTKKMLLDIDLNSCFLKGAPEPTNGKSAFDQLCLVPDFQTCLMARLYFIRIIVKHKNGSIQAVHVPLTIYS